LSKDKTFEVCDATRFNSSNKLGKKINKGIDKQQA